MRKIVSGIILTLLLVGTLTSAFNIQPVKAEPRTWTVDDDLQDFPNADFTKIQDAVDHATEGDTVVVYQGTYHEVIDVRKSIILKGVDLPIIDGEGRSIAIYVQADRCTIQGLKVVNFISVGIYVPYSTDNTISDNCVLGITYTGIYLNRANKNIVRQNLIQGCREGIFIEEGDENHILYNNIIGNFYGVMLGRGGERSDNNMIYLNNFTENTVNAYVDVGSNFWDDRSKGNYWSNYKGTDADGDGIGDTPYVINDYNIDRYPLMKPWLVRKLIESVDITVYYDSWKYDIKTTVSTLITWYLYDIKKNLAHTYEEPDYCWATGHSGTFSGYIPSGEDGYVHLKVVSQDGRVEWWPSESEMYRIKRPLQKMVKPVEGSITSPYGWRLNPFTGKWEFHKGIDIDRTANLKPVRAPADGVVERLGFDDPLAGNWVVIRHEKVVRLDGEMKGPVFTKYFHLDRVDVTKGQKLMQGDIIGTVGQTGKVTGPHLHFEVWEGDSHVDPVCQKGYVDYSKTGIIVTAKSPVDIVLVDPDGLTVSKELIEIVEIASYLESDLGDRIWITERKIGDYQIIVITEPIALPTDTYTLEFSADGITIVLAENIQISNIPSQPYIVRSTETEVIPIIPATIDFDPDTLNLVSNGTWVTVYVELPVGHGYDVSMIDVASITLNGQVLAEAKPIEIGDYDGDGIPDLMVKFNRTAVHSILEVGEELEISISGKIIDGRLFEGSDTIRIISEGK